MSSQEDEISFECVRPLESHGKLIMQWRNDPHTLRMSFHSTPKIDNYFFEEFQRDYFVFPDLPPLFVLVGGQRVAFLRFKPIAHPQGLHRKCCDISINVAPEYRRQGIGKKSLKALQAWLKQQGYQDLYAEVKRENLPSKHLFESVGFTKLPDHLKIVEETSEQVAICCYLMALTPEAPCDGQSVFIIAEAGSNWRMGSYARDVAMAKAMIELAAEAKANAIKFQLFRPETIYAPHAGVSDYLSEAGIQKEMEEIFQDLAMPYEMVPLLAEECQRCGIQFMCSSFSPADFKAIDPYVSVHKIASYEIGHIHLLQLAARSKKPLLLSTGAATEQEIAWAVNTFYEAGGEALTLLQCTAKYPTEGRALHLRTIPWLKQRFKTQVGLSDHSRHPIESPVAAVALGATVIEKHFTIHNSLPGPDHAFAITPVQLKEMVKSIRLTEQMLGSPIKIIDSCEEELRSFARRGIQALKEIQKGELLKEDLNIAILRPGKQPLGIHPKYIAQVSGRHATRPIPAGEGIQKEDWIGA
ncbi:MAG: GNAT family N-acetyltransferase [Verrucomicrobia bacterium]|nr:GNAT family N-acetyltransferase [Verrucomicrobiota bacterium]